MRSNRLPGKSAACIIALLGIAISAATPVAAQKKGGTLRLYHNDNPPSASLLEESTIASVNAVCEVITTGTQSNLMVNRVNPPFDNPDTRKAMSLALDRQVFNRR